jgi:dTDP-4-dehydrorhamnose 3,5-epimerase
MRVGIFFESYNKKEFEQEGLTTEFVQDNQSFSSYGTIRGLHFQKSPYIQSKLVRVYKEKFLTLLLIYVKIARLSVRILV